MNDIDWLHIEWAASVDKARDIQPRDFEDYKWLASVAVSQRAEITQLRAELEQERELADRLASGADNVDYMERPNSLDDALYVWRTRRNK